MATTTISGTTDVEDTWVASTNGNSNYGGSINRVTTSVAPILNRISQASIPSGTIASASMFLYAVAFGLSGALKTQAIKDANTWVEGTANGPAQTGSCCWNYLAYSATTPTNWAGSAGCATLGTDIDSSEESTTGTISGVGWIEVVITSTLVSDWKSGARVPNGVRSVGVGGISVTINSTEAASNQPYWEVDATSGVSAFISRRSPFTNRRTINR